MKGIVLAGGSSTRLSPATRVLSKQLLPIYDKPMIFYPLSTLMLADIREFLIITRPEESSLFQKLLGDGKRLGITISYATQPAPKGIAQAMLIAEDFLAGSPAALILGDNIFFGAGLPRIVRKAKDELTGCALFGYRVTDAQRYGVATLAADGRVIALHEKPKVPASDIAITGLYLYDSSAVAMTKELTPSPRGELEITDLNSAYVKQGRAHLELFGRGMAWLDTGTFDSLLEASEFVRSLQHRQGIHVACLEEVAFCMGFITAAELEQLSRDFPNSPYGDYLLQCARDPSR